MMNNSNCQKSMKYFQKDKMIHMNNIVMMIMKKMKKMQVKRLKNNLKTIRNKNLQV